jgi:hypothetical protein
MTDTTTATVATLTATVHVLQVGSRQITLSVAKQLDCVDRENIEPMGRIRLNDGVELIGRGPDGTLVRSHVTPEASAYRTNRDWVHLPNKAVWVCRRAPLEQSYWDNAVLYRLTGSDFSVTISQSAADVSDDCPPGMPSADHSGHWWMRQQIDLAACAVERDRRNAALKAARASDLALPLIVLAGLK